MGDDEFSEESFRQFFDDVEGRVMAERDDPEFDRLKSEFGAEPDNLDICYKLAIRSKELEKYELCIELLLKILEQDKNFGDALEEIKDVFVVLGSSNELVKRSRKELSMILY